MLNTQFIQPFAAAFVLLLVCLLFFCIFLLHFIPLWFTAFCSTLLFLKVPNSLDLFKTELTEVSPFY